MNLSLVICTKDRGDRLRPCLDAIDALAKPAGFELVLVNNASTDDTEAVLRGFADAADFKVVVVNEPIAGLAKARNTGWQASSGQIVAFTDDDCYVRSDYAERILALFTKREIDYFAGRIELHDPTDYPITILLEDKERHFAPRQFLFAGEVQGANFGVSRSALEACEGFNELLGAGTDFPAEDIEIVGRLSAMGCTGAYSPEIVVAHHHGRKAGPTVKKLKRDYNAGRGAYYAEMALQRGLRLKTLVAFVGVSIRRHPASVIHEIYWGGRYLWRRWRGG